MNAQLTPKSRSGVFVTRLGKSLLFGSVIFAFVAFVAFIADVVVEAFILHESPSLITLGIVVSLLADVGVMALGAILATWSMTRERQ